MDSSNKEDVLSLAQNGADKAKIHLILDELFINKNIDIPDPYYEDSQVFESVYQMLDQSCERIVNRL